MRAIKRKTTVTIAAFAVVALGAGGAYAYWTSTGSGSGAGSTGTNSPFTVTGGAITGPALTPGGPSQSVAFTVTNPGSGNQYLTSVVATVANASGSAWTAVSGCSSLDYTVGVPAITYGQIAPSGVVNGTVTVSMNNLGTNQDACKTVAYPLYFAAS
jgi:hypothetical protein